MVKSVRLNITSNFVRLNHDMDALMTHHHKRNLFCTDHPIKRTLILAAQLKTKTTTQKTFIKKSVLLITKVEEIRFQVLQKEIVK